MDGRAVVVALALAAFTTSTHADAGADRPVFVTLVGRGVIRLRLAAGITAPCDSSENRMIFDGPIGPGRYRWDTGASDVCFQHTSRSLPDSEWSESQVLSTRSKTGPREILLSTD